MLLRDVRPDDVELYVRMRCDPAMMTELGGPQDAERMPAKVASDVSDVAAGRAWIRMVVPEPDRPEDVAGSVVIWEHDGIEEMGWMVLPEHQGKGVAKAAVQMLLDEARTTGRWGVVHAYPGVTNAPSNALCRSVGFHLVGEEQIEFAGRWFPCNHWEIDLRQ